MSALPPVDYPESGDKKISDSADLTYAALLDLAEAEKPITDEMIREACKKMEAAQQFPFASSAQDENTHIENLMNKLRSVRK